jgi:hypothetical protein
MCFGRHPHYPAPALITMVSTHKKFKSWRKGKGKKEKTKSVKKQLRSQKRLLAKLNPSSTTTELVRDTAADTKNVISDKIQELEKVLEQKRKQKLEKKFATKYHTIKFFERQKLTRMLRSLEKKLNLAKDENDEDNISKFHAQIRCIQRDMIYVAYFPKDRKYMALFHNGERVVDDSRAAKKRSSIRKQIAEEIQGGKITVDKGWIGKDILFDSIVNMLKDDLDENVEYSSNDNRRAEKRDKHTMIEASSSSSSSEISSSDSSQSDDSSEESDVSSEDSDDESRGKNVTLAPALTPNPLSMETVESDDDFLIEENVTDAREIFAKAASLPVIQRNKYGRGDKSMGWATQKQRPGEWKRKRERR